MTHPLFEVRNLSLKISNNSGLTVDNVSFSLRKGQCVGIVGESGSGKTLTALSIIQLLPANIRMSVESKIIYNNNNLLNYCERQMRRIRGKTIAMIFQDAMSAFNPVLTVGQQIQEVMMLHLNLTRKTALHHAGEILHESGIVDVPLCLRSYPHELSGGMRQRAMIAMALSANPELLIADEPTTALDTILQSQILALLKKLIYKRQMSVLFISHDLRISAQLADEIVVLKKGKKVESGPRQKIFTQPQHPYTQKLMQSLLTLEAQKISQSCPREILRIRNLRVYYPIRKGLFRKVVDHLKAVDDLNLQLFSGETFALVGESGSGKTTVAKAIVRLIQITTGKIWLDGVELTELSKKNLTKQRQNLQIIFQDPYTALNPRMLVGESLTEGVKTTMDIDHLLNLVELPLAAKWKYPHEFSGGERQRICLARALARQPKLLILDEPTSALDVSIQKQMLSLLNKLQKELGLTYLLITHDWGVVAYLANRVGVMHRGKLVESGAAVDLLAAPQNEYTRQLIASVSHVRHIF